MKNFKRFVMATFAVIVTATSVFSALPVYAADSSALSIAPKKQYLIEPGKGVDDTLVIRNLDQTSDLQLTLRVIDFSFTDVTGTPKLFTAVDAPQTTWSLRPFLTIPKTVTVGPGKTQTLKMNVSIPAGQGAGSYYSAIMYSTGAPNGGNVGLSASGVTLVFVNVPGKVSEDLQIKKVGAYNKVGIDSESNFVFMTTSEPLNVAYTLVNNGNVAESPVGSIKLDNLLFGRTVNVDNVNPTGALALRGQTRLFTPCIKTQAQNVDFNGTSTTAATCVSAGLWPGIYKISADMFYGQNGNATQEITKVGYFLYFPWWFTILSVVVILLVAYFVWRIVLFVRQRFGVASKKKQK